jgi:hypothetical protein
MPWLTALAGYVAPLFLVLSPVFSYSDQAISMYRSKSSAGFSLDIPLIMLVASMLRSVCREGLLLVDCPLTMSRLQNILLPRRTVRRCLACPILPHGSGPADRPQNCPGSPTITNIEGRGCGDAVCWRT